MATLIRNDGPFATLSRAVKTNEGWPALDDAPEHPYLTTRAVGPFLSDAYAAHLVDFAEIPDVGNFLSTIIHEGQYAGIMLAGWTDEQVHQYRSAMWRWCHGFMVDNADLVDRGPELEELAKLLGDDK